jgi:hypothetical protein
MEHPSVVYPPGPLQLTAEDQKLLEVLADRLVAETLHASQDFAAQGHVADPSSWKVIKQKENIVVYQEVGSESASKRDRVWSEDTDVVEASPKNPTLFPTSGRSLTDFLQQDAQEDEDSEDEDQGYHHDDFVKFGAKGGFETSVLEKFRPNAPVVFSSGVFPGTVDDVALAFLADTDERGQKRFNTNTEVVAEDTRILAQIHGPTRDDPFRFLGVKWCSHTPSRAVALVVRPRDYLIVESTGMALDSNGARFCYVLNHSIEMDEVPDFRDFGQVRLKFSTCHIMKPREDIESVDIYSRGYLLIGGGFGTRVGTLQLAEGLLAVPKVMEEAYLKKLTWLMCDRYSLSSSSGSTSDSNSFSSSGSSKLSLSASSACSCCHGKLSSKLGGFMERNAACSLCRLVICHKCRVKKSLPQESSRGRHVKKKDVEFCINCYLKAKRLSAWHVAVSTLKTTST